MSPTPTPFRIIEDAAPALASDDRSSSGRIPRWAGVALAVIGAAVLGALAMLQVGTEERAFRRLPMDERAALYQRTMENLTSVCATEGKETLHDFCRDQAQLALMLPECDGTCAATAREILRTATR